MSAEKFFKLKKYIISALALTAITCTVCLFCGCGQRQVLSAPQNLKVEAEVLTWDAVENAVGYAVEISGNEYETESNELDILDKTLGEELKGTGLDTFVYEIKVMALGDWQSTCDSDWSETYEHEQKFIQKFYGKSSYASGNGFKEEVYTISAEKTAVGKLVVPEYVNDIRVISVHCPVGCTSLYLPDTVTKASFVNCKNLTAVRLSENIKGLNYDAFANCESLKKLKLPKKIEWFNGSQYLNCKSLTEITVDEDNEIYRTDGDKIIRKADDALMFAVTNAEIPQGVRIIEQYAFYTRSYDKLYIPQSVTEIKEEAFENSHFDEIEIDEANGAYKYEGGVLTEKSSSDVIVAAFGIDKIPVGITEISHRAFATEPDRKQVFIPSTVKKIGGNAFHYCFHLSVTIPESVEEIQFKAIWGRIYVSENQNMDGWVYNPVTSDSWLGLLARAYYNCKIKYDGSYPYVHAIRYGAKADNGYVFQLPSREDAPVRDGYTLLGFTTVEGGTTPEIIFEDYADKLWGTIKVETDSEYLYAVWQKNAE